MTGERSEIEALASRISNIIEDTMHVPWQDAEPAAMAIAEEFARRLQPARVPEEYAEHVLSEYVRIQIAEHDERSDKRDRVDAMRRALAAAAPAPEAAHSCRNCLGIDPASCMFNPAPEAAPQTQGEAVATVCLTPEAYAGGHMMDLQVQVAPGTTFAIGDKLYIHPAPVADALVFADTDPEAGFIADAQRLNCPACGGSGHVGDVITSGDGGVDEMLTDLKRCDTLVAHPKISARMVYGSWAITHMDTIRSLTSAQQAGMLENRLELAMEDIEAFHMAMDDAQVPRADEHGVLSMFGRALVFANHQRTGSRGDGVEHPECTQRHLCDCIAKCKHGRGGTGAIERQPSCVKE